MSIENRKTIGPNANFEIPKTIFTPPIPSTGRIFQYKRIGDQCIQSTTSQEANFMMSDAFKIPVIIAAGVASSASSNGNKAVVSSNLAGINKAEELLKMAGFQSE